MNVKTMVTTVLLLIGGMSLAHAEVGIGLRGGTLGYGVDLDIALVEKLNLRLAYNYFNYDQTIDDTDAVYDGTLKISSASAILDWHAFGGGVRFSFGGVTSGPKIDIVGTPTSGTYEIGDRTYSAANIGFVRGQIKVGNSLAPYIGLGYGNVVGKSHRVTFLFDLGAIYGGTPNVTLEAQCRAGVPTNICSQATLNSDVQTEIQDMKNEMTAVKWYPVINVGIGFRF